jgi:hypothetical protein
MEKEAPQEKKLIIPKPGDIFSALGIEIEKPEVTRKPSTEADFVAFCLDTIEYHNTLIKKAEDNYQSVLRKSDREIDKVLGSLQKARNYTALNFKLKYWEEEITYTNKDGTKRTFINMGFDVDKKPKPGFTKKNENL